MTETLAPEAVEELREAHDNAIVEGSVAGDGSKVILDILVEGKGNRRDRHYYSKELLARVAPLFEGAQQYRNHISKSAEQSLEGLPRPIEELAGVIDRTWIDTRESDGRAVLRGEAEIVDPAVRSVVRQRPDLLGVSINGRGPSVEAVREGENVKDVQDIKNVRSVDWVSKAGAGGKVQRILEAADADEYDDEIEAETDSHMKCSKCGAKVLRESERCRECGALMPGGKKDMKREGEGTTAVAERPDVEDVEEATRHHHRHRKGSKVRFHHPKHGEVEGTVVNDHDGDEHHAKVRTRHGHHRVHHRHIVAHHRTREAEVEDLDESYLDAAGLDDFEPLEESEYDDYEEGEGLFRDGTFGPEWRGFVEHPDDLDTHQYRRADTGMDEFDRERGRRTREADVEEEIESRAIEIANSKLSEAVTVALDRMREHYDGLLAETNTQWERKFSQREQRDAAFAVIEDAGLPVESAKQLKAAFADVFVEAETDEDGVQKQDPIAAVKAKAAEAVGAKKDELANVTEARITEAGATEASQRGPGVRKPSPRRGRAAAHKKVEQALGIAPKR